MAACDHRAMQRVTGWAWTLRWGRVALPLVVFSFHAWFFRDWIIDDAGISYVYARNLAVGAGLVAQPGQAPVEGYSNPLWVFVLVPFFKLGIFHPVIVPKALGLGLVAV